MASLVYTTALLAWGYRKVNVVEIVSFHGQINQYMHVPTLFPVEQLEFDVSKSEAGFHEISETSDI